MQDDQQQQQQSAATEAYLRTELLYSLVLEVVHHDRYTEDADAMQDDGDARSLALADLLLTVAHAERLLAPRSTSLPNSDARLESRAASQHGGEDSDATVLGLSAASLRRGVGLSDEQQLRAHEEAAQLSLLPRIERKLRVKCTELCDLLLPSLTAHRSHVVQSADGGAPSSAASSSLPSSALARVAELPALLLEAQARRAQVEYETRQLRASLHEQLQQDLARCRDIAALLTELLQTHKRDDQPRVVLAKAQWLAALARTMQLKAQVLTHELVVETYPADSVAVLHAAHAELLARKARALDERDSLQAKLQLYASADQQYHAIAHEYGAVLQSIDEKRSWLRSLDV